MAIQPRSLLLLLLLPGRGDMPAVLHCICTPYRYVGGEGSIYVSIYLSIYPATCDHPSRTLPKPGPKSHRRYWPLSCNMVSRVFVPSQSDGGRRRRWPRLREDAARRMGTSDSDSLPPVVNHTHLMPTTCI